MEAHEVDPQGAELVKGVHQLAQAASEAVVTVDNHGIHQPPAALRKHTIQRRPVLLRSAAPLVHILPGDLPPAPAALFPDFIELHFRILAVVRAHPRVNRRSFHRLPPLVPLRGRPPSLPHLESSCFECLLARACPPSRAQACLWAAVVVRARASPPRLPSATA